METGIESIRVMFVILCKFSVQKHYFDGNVPYEIFKSWNNKGGDQIKTNYLIFVTTANANICLMPYLQIKQKLLRLSQRTNSV